MEYFITSLLFVGAILMLWSYYEEKVEELEDEYGFDTSGTATIFFNGGKLTGQYFMQDDGTMQVFVDEEVDIEGQG